MAALALERATRNQDTVWTHFHEPLPLENTVKAFKGGLAGLYISGATVGEIAPFKVSPDMIGLGRFVKTVDNAADGLSVQVEAGVFIWENAAAGDAIVAGSVGRYAYGLDDQTVGIDSQTDTSDPVINTITPTAVNDTQYALSIRYRRPGNELWQTTTIAALGDATATATEICDAYRVSLLANDDLTGVIAGTGTTTLILTGAEGVTFESEDIGAGVSAVVVTDAGTLTGIRSKVGVVMDLCASGPAILTHPAVFNGAVII